MHACTYVGSIYLLGEGVPKNAKKAVDLFQLPASLNNLLANYYLGFCYRNGVGVAPDINRAIVYLSVAAVRCCTYAQWDLAVILESGERGVAVNRHRAMHYYRMAADLGHRAARHKVGSLFVDGLGVQRYRITEDDMRLMELVFLELASKRKSIDLS